AARLDLDPQLPGARLAPALARATGATVLLKGAVTLIAPGDCGPLRAQDDATPQLATAGTGGVLAGALGTLLAAGVSGPHAARGDPPPGHSRHRGRARRGARNAAGRGAERPRRRHRGRDPPRPRRPARLPRRAATAGRARRRRAPAGDDRDYPGGRPIVNRGAR